MNSKNISMYQFFKVVVQFKITRWIICLVYFIILNHVNYWQAIKNAHACSTSLLWQAATVDRMTMETAFVLREYLACLQTLQHCRRHHMCRQHYTCMQIPVCDIHDKGKKCKSTKYVGVGSSLNRHIRRFTCTPIWTKKFMTK